MLESSFTPFAGCKQCKCLPATPQTADARFPESESEPKLYHTIHPPSGSMQPKLPHWAVQVLKDPLGKRLNDSVKRASVLCAADRICIVAMRTRAHPCTCMRTWVLSSGYVPSHCIRLYPSFNLAYTKRPRVRVPRERQAHVLARPSSQGDDRVKCCSHPTLGIKFHSFGDRGPGTEELRQRAFLRLVTVNLKWRQESIITGLRCG
jgi:hypothetical protein